MHPPGNGGCGIQHATNMKIKTIPAIAVLCAVLPSVSQAATVLSHWDFDNASIASPGESGGNVLLAAQGSGTLADGNIEGNTATGLTGVFGEAFSFDGDGDKLYLFARGSWANNPRVNGANGDIASQTLNNFSISVWVNPTAFLGNDVIYGNNYVAGNGWDLRLVNGQLTMEARNGSTSVLSSGTTLNTGVWSHVVMNYHDGQADFFVNGSAAGSASVGGAFTELGGATTNVQISREGSEAFNGSMDELWLFSGNLTSGEINALYTANAIPEPGSAALLGMTALGVLARRRRK